MLGSLKACHALSFEFEDGRSVMKQLSDAPDDDRLIDDVSLDGGNDYDSMDIGKVMVTDYLQDLYGLKKGPRTAPSASLDFPHC